MPAGYALQNQDCDDTDASINPNALEVCDGIDNNCDGNIDIDCIGNGDGDGDIFTGCNPFENSFKNQGGFVSSLAHYTNWLKKHNKITGRKKGQIMSSKASQYKFEIKIKAQGSVYDFNDSEDDDDDDNDEETYENSSSADKSKGNKSNNGKAKGKKK